jgi:hypothetical protein
VVIGAQSSGSRQRGIFISNNIISEDESEN